MVSRQHQKSLYVWIYVYIQMCAQIHSLYILSDALSSTPETTTRMYICLYTNICADSYTAYIHKMIFHQHQRSLYACIHAYMQMRVWLSTYIFHQRIPVNTRDHSCRDSCQDSCVYVSVCERMHVRTHFLHSPFPENYLRIDSRWYLVARH